MEGLEKYGQCIYIYMVSLFGVFFILPWFNLFYLMLFVECLYIPSFVILCHLQVIRHFDGCKADIVVCDGAPDGKIIFLVFNFSVYGLYSIVIISFLPLELLKFALFPLYLQLLVFMTWMNLFSPNLYLL